MELSPNHNIPPRWKKEEPDLGIQVTPEQLKKIAPVRESAIETFLPHINKFLAPYEVDTVQRVATFLAQILHESGNLRYTKEIWGPTTQQKKYERDFKAPWGKDLDRDQRNYLPYMLGNKEPGDGKFFAGRGILQITGRTNYMLCSIALFGNAEKLLQQPQLLEVPEYAVQSAFWFICDFKKLLDEFDTVDLKDDTRKINGGYNGLAEREQLYRKAMAALS